MRYKISANGILNRKKSRPRNRSEIITRDIFCPQEVLEVTGFGEGFQSVEHKAHGEATYEFPQLSLTGLFAYTTRYHNSTARVRNRRLSGLTMEPPKCVRDCQSPGEGKKDCCDGMTTFGAVVYDDFQPHQG